ncbi:hypothetical protein [Chitinophaga caseinilytica]|uniref:hypothetical protein n=1 Tax=Chitinophaga caseinilytica TaxID=2267521 RepID=UPI003C2BEE76
MKTIKFAALAVAIIAIGTAFAVNANAIGKRTITSCFRSVDLQNAANSAFYSPAISDAKATVESNIITNSIKYLDAAPSTVITTGLPNSLYFSCLTLTETLETLPNVQQFTIGGVTAKWVVSQIQYKPTQN